MNSESELRFAPPAPVEIPAVKEEIPPPPKVAPKGSAPAKEDIVLDPYSYPNPRTAMELLERMRSYFMMYPDEWLVNVLMMAKASNWPEGKAEDCMLKFCLYKEKTGDFKRTFNQYRADLTLWFIDERTKFARQSQSQPGASAYQSNTTHKANLNRLGGDASKYDETPLF